MATRKTRKKVIDGVVKNPKSPKNSKDSSKNPETPKNLTDDIKITPAKEEPISEEEPISISVKDTTVNVIEDEDTEDISLPEEEALVSSAILEEEAIDKNLDDLINDLEEDTDTSNNFANNPARKISNLDDTSNNYQEDDEDKVLNSITRQEKQDSMNTEKKSKKTPAKAKPFRIISRLLALGTTAATVAIMIRIAITGIVPSKYLIPAIAILAVILIFYLFKAFRNKTRIPVLVILDLIGVALAAVSIFGFIKIDETMAFLNNNFNDNSKEYSIYNVIVNKKSSYNSLDDVKGKIFHSISDFVDTSKLESAVKDQANGTVVYADGITSLLQGALDDNSYIALLNSGTYSSATDGDNDKSKTYTDNLKIIGEIKVESEKQTAAASDSNLTEKSFTVYLSGIDTRSGLMLDRSLSDVNIVITVNPKTKNILMSTIPRDYYVQLHGTTGLPDKLTHAGSLGGVQLSMATIGDLLNISFDRYIRVNFNFVINLVNAIGGITIYSDVDYDITAHTNRSCVFHPGNNTVNGECALAFARERYAYSDGDRHRGRNQEQVIQKIFEKVTSSSTLIGKYSDILNALNGSFDTNISTEDITGLVNMQLSDMAKWTIDSYNLDGTGGSAYTYSYPNQLLYVMYPDQTTVDTAKQKIKAILEGNSSNSGSLPEPAAN